MQWHVKNYNRQSGAGWGGNFNNAKHGGETKMLHSDG